MSEIYLKVDKICKSYKDANAITDISFKVNKGELFGFIGPDGAGKTTIFRILATLLLPDNGKVTINGFDAVKQYKNVRQIIGYMPGRFSLYHDLSVEENLNFFATIFGTSIEENYNLVKHIYSHIEPFKKRRAGKLSGGMKQKLALSCALIHKPEILILDEPTTGVDAVSRREFWEMLKNLQKMDITIVVSTPYMDEAELCDRVALIQSGKIMKIDKPKSITTGFNKIIYSIFSDNVYKLLTDLRKYKLTESAYPFGQQVHLILKDNNGDIQNLKEFLILNNHKEVKIKLSEPTIEDCFMDLMVTN